MFRVRLRGFRVQGRQGDGLLRTSLVGPADAALWARHPGAQAEISQMPSVIESCLFSLHSLHVYIHMYMYMCLYRMHTYVHRYVHIYIYVCMLVLTRGLPYTRSPTIPGSPTS